MLKGTIPNLVLITSFICSVAGVGCDRNRNDEGLINSPPPSPGYAQLAATQNQRVQRLSHLRATGQIQIAWTENGEERYEDVQAMLVLRQPGSTALSLTKLGQRFIWLGSNESYQWVFDLSTDETIAYVVAVGVVSADDLQTRQELLGSIYESEPTVLPRPRTLLDLLGLIELPDPAGENQPTVVYHEELAAWTVEVPGREGPLRIAFATDSLLPIRTELLSDGGDVLYRVELSAYRAVEISNAPPGLFPEFPTRIAATNVLSAAHFDLFLNKPTGRTTEVKDRFFDFPTLVEYLQPDKIEGEHPSHPAADN